jgi:hypothetical protein
MNLTYRGISYQTSNLTVNTQKTKVSATYRGQSYQVSNPFKFISKPVENLIYRGVKYHNSTNSNSTPIAQDLQPIFN